MKVLHFSVVIFLCLAIALPTVEGWGRFRFRGRRIISRIAKPLCHAAVGVGCSKVGISAAGCRIVDPCRRRKRSAEIEEENEMVYYPISDDFEEYDDNDDDLIEYEEFAFDFLARWQFTNPEELRIIFKDVDTDDDGFLDSEEFFAAPWDFGSYDVKVKKTPISEPLRQPVDETTD